MPILDFPIAEHKHNILRPIAYKVMRDLVKFTGMAFLEEVPIFYLDEHNSRKEISGLHTDGTPNVTVEIEEEEFDQTIGLYQRYQPEFYPIFYNKATHADITPHYAQTTCRMSITAKFRSKASAKRWQNTMRDKLRSHIEGYQHNLSYHMLIPRGMLLVLNQVHKLVIARDKTVTDNFINWLKESFTNQIGTVSTQAGTQPDLAFHETALQARGFFKFDGQPEEGEMVDGSGAWTIAVDYELQYMRPTTLSLYYPMVVYNQLLPNVLLGLEEDGSPKQRTAQVDANEEYRYRTVSGNGLKNFSEIEIQEERSYVHGISVPWWDEFYVDKLYSIVGTNRLADFLILMDEGDGVDTPIFNLKDLSPEVVFNKVAHDFLLSECDGRYVLVPSESLFQVVLYRWDKMVLNSIRIDKDYNVYLTKPIDMAGVYHLRIAMYYDTKYLSSDAIDRIPGELEIDDGSIHDNFNHRGILHMKTVQTFYTENLRMEDGKDLPLR